MNVSGAAHPHHGIGNSLRLRALRYFHTARVPPFPPESTATFARIASCTTAKTAKSAKSAIFARIAFEVPSWTLWRGAAGGGVARQVLGEWEDPAQGRVKTSLTPGQPHQRHPPTTKRETQQTPAFQPSVLPRHHEPHPQKQTGRTTETKTKRNKTTPYKTTPFQRPKLNCLLYTSPSPRDGLLSRMPSSA